MDAGKDIDKIQRLIPEEQVRRLTQGGRQEHLLFLPLAVFLNPFFKLDSFQSQFSEHGSEKRVVQSTLFGKGGKCPVQPGGVL